jgi:hypothetical protein
MKRESHSFIAPSDKERVILERDRGTMVVGTMFANVPWMQGLEVKLSEDEILSHTYGEQAIW